MTELDNSPHSNIVIPVMLSFAIALCVGAFIYYGFNSCNAYQNPDESPVPTVDYFKIPDHCINHTRLYPDSSFTTKSGITFTYRELPDIGAATITSISTLNGYEYYSMVERSENYRGRFAINETHRLFESIAKTNVISLETNSCYLAGVANGS